MKINKLLRIWLIICDIQQVEFARRIGIRPNKLSEIMLGVKKRLPDNFVKGFIREFGFRPTNTELLNHITVSLDITPPPAAEEEPTERERVIELIKESIEKDIYESFRRKFESSDC